VIDNIRLTPQIPNSQNFVQGILNVVLPRAIRLKFNKTAKNSQFSALFDFSLRLIAGCELNDFAQWLA